MNKTAIEIYPALDAYLNGLLPEVSQISKERKVTLDKLVAYISRKQSENKPVQLTFICTHNSRRSHISQVWAATAALFFGQKQVLTFSGGTEATAFNPRAVSALERAGFQIHNPGGENPRYQVSFSAQHPPLVCFSKVFDAPENPPTQFAAIMTCSDADENCPFIPGAEFRLPLTYDDPKEADGTAYEESRYDERVRQIGVELMYVFQQVSTI